MILNILVIHLLLSILFSGMIYLKEKSLNYAITSLLISLAIPLFGVILFSIVRFDFLNSRVSQNDYIAKAYSGRNYFKDLDIADETNVVSIEEALLISDTDYRREIMMKALKKDALKYIQFISTAINNDDPETAHYAAASMLNMRRALDIKMRETLKIRDENADNISIAMDYFDITDSYINIFDIDSGIRAKYIDDNILILKTIIEDKVGTPQKYIMRLIELLVASGNYEEAKKYCKIFLLSYPDNEDKYEGLLES